MAWFLKAVLLRPGVCQTQKTYQCHSMTIFYLLILVVGLLYAISVGSDF